MSASNPRQRNGNRRRKLRRRVLAAYDVCAICGRWVDKSLPQNDPGAPEVDEIIPVSLGGDPLAWRNVQLAHRICNIRKGNKVGEQPVEQRPVLQPKASRQW